MTGGGFGGCCVALVKTAAVEAITNKITTEYEAKTGSKATIFSSRPAAGAMVILNSTERSL
jgi:galactokinase